MKKVFTRLFVTALFAFVVLIAIQSESWASHSWGNYHWGRTSNPFTLKLGDNVSGPWDSILGTTSTDWTKSTVLNTTIVAGGSGGGKKCNATAGRVEVCNNSYGKNGWLGVANIWANGDHITQGTVRLNDTYMNAAPYNTTAWRNLVSCQEVGHTFGLDHQDENFNNANLGTCMDYTNDPSTNQHPNQHDYDQLQTIYSHTDSTNTVFRPETIAPAAWTETEFTDRGQWGRLVQISADGKTSTYVQDFGNGYKVFTFVIWAGTAPEFRDRNVQQ